MVLIIDPEAHLNEVADIKTGVFLDVRRHDKIPPTIADRHPRATDGHICYLAFDPEPWETVKRQVRQKVRRQEQHLVRDDPRFPHTMQGNLSFEIMGEVIQVAATFTMPALCCLSAMLIWVFA